MCQKQCSKCKIKKNFANFHKRTVSPDGYAVACKSCKRIQDEVYRNKNEKSIRAKKKKYHEINKEEISAKRREDRRLNGDLIREREKEYWLTNKDKKALKDKKYREAHLEERKAYQRIYRHLNKEKRSEYDCERRQNDVQYRLSCNLRTRLTKALKGKYKSGSAVRDLGCSIEELKVWLEQQFQKGMSWQNYGPQGWHIDHIVPLNSFDLSKPPQFKKACHWFNLRPLWAKENCSKGSKL